jgi:hypothetical protein
MSQKPGIRQVLIFENREPQGMRVAAELRKSSNPISLRVMTASNLSTVRQVMKAQAFAAVIIEVGRESGEALAALRLLGKEDPLIPIYIYNGFMLPRIAEKSLEYNHVRYFDDHTDFGHFIAIILGELSKKRRGIIHGIALDSFLQLMNSEKFNGQISVVAGGKRGILFLRGGRLLGASMNGARNDTALAEMSGWEKITVEIREEQPADQIAKKESRNAGPDSDPSPCPSAMNQEAGTGHIDILQFNLQGKKIVIDIRKLNAALQEVQDLLADVLLRMDVFLSANGRSLAGWNSHPLACSAFAAITHSIMDSLHESAFPRLQHYYLLDLAEGHMVLIMVEDELQWGLLLKDAGGHMGIVLNIVLPIALKAMKNTLQPENSL